MEPDRIEIESGEYIVLSWSDGTTDRIAAHVLRDACPCADCRNPVGVRPPADPEVSRIVNASLVGAYAISVVFAPDGHSMGIFPFDGLHELAQTQKDVG
ncbi:MAG: DUF971 domain-containing protein [Acidimicrobiia bacterium]